jgi:hypothetical protein
MLVNSGIKVGLFSMKKFFIALTVIFGIGFILLASDKPEKAYARIQTDIKNEDWADVYRQLSQKTKQEIEIGEMMIAQHLDALGVKSDAKLTPEEKFIRSVKDKSKILRSFIETPSYKLLSVKNNDDFAILTISVPTMAENKDVKMKKEKGLWKLDIDLSQPYKSVLKPQ